MTSTFMLLVSLLHLLFLFFSLIVYVPVCFVMFGIVSLPFSSCYCSVNQIIKYVLKLVCAVASLLGVGVVGMECASVSDNGFSDLGN